MESLLLKNDGVERWYPQSVDFYKSSIKILNYSPENQRLRSNFAYSMQYIEYLEKQLGELKLSTVLITMLYKTYIITGMGIIELLFVYLLKHNELWNQTEWEEYAEFKSNPKEIEDITIKSETKLYKKVPPYDMRMDLDSMIKKVEKKHLLSIDHDVFPALKRLRELRNRVHLQLGEDAYDHDYNSINFNEIQTMRQILYTILTAPEICNNKAAFKFIFDVYSIGA